MERGVWWLMAYGPWGSQSIGHNWVTNTVKLQNNCKETGNFLGSKNLYLDVNKCARMWSSVQFSHSVMSDSATPWTEACQAPCPSPTPRVYSSSCPLSQWCHPTISSPSPLALSLSQYQGLFKWVSSSHEVAKVLGSQLQHQSFQWTPRTGLL